MRSVNFNPASHEEGSNNLLVLDGSLEAPPRNTTGKQENSNRISEIDTGKNPLNKGGESDIPVGARAPTEKTGPPVDGENNTDLEM